MIASVLDDDELASENSPMDLEKFDNDMSNMFKVIAEEFFIFCFCFWIVIIIIIYNRKFRYSLHSVGRKKIC